MPWTDDERLHAIKCYRQLWPQQELSEQLAEAFIDGLSCYPIDAVVAVLHDALLNRDDEYRPSPGSILQALRANPSVLSDAERSPQSDAEPQTRLLPRPGDKSPENSTEGLERLIDPNGYDGLSLATYDEHIAKFGDRYDAETLEWLRGVLGDGTEKSKAFIRNEAKKRHEREVRQRTALQRIQERRKRQKRKPPKGAKGDWHRDMSREGKERRRRILAAHAAIGLPLDIEHPDAGLDRPAPATNDVAPQQSAAIEPAAGVAPEGEDARAQVDPPRGLSPDHYTDDEAPY